MEGPTLGLGSPICALQLTAGQEDRGLQAPPTRERESSWGLGQLPAVHGCYWWHWPVSHSQAHFSRTSTLTAPTGDEGSSYTTVPKSPQENPSNTGIWGLWPWTQVAWEQMMALAFVKGSWELCAESRPLLAPFPQC